MAKKLKFGNGKWATKKGSTLAYNDENNNFKPLPFTTTRDSKATRVNKEGLIEVVSNDVPRIDYTDSADGVLLLEPARTNSITYSNDFTQSAWVKTRVSISSNVVVSPDGTLTADKIISDATLNSHFIRDDISSTIGVVSVFAKADEFTFLKLSTNAFGFQASYFDLVNGTFDEGADHIAKIEDYGNGWFRCSIYVSQAFTQFYIENSGNSASATHLGDGTSGIYIWGAQAEQGSYATSYIPTNGTTVTRLADTASGSGNSEVFNDSEGVLFADIAALANDSANRVITLSDGTTSNRVQIYFDTSNGITGGVATQASIPYSTNIEISSKVAFKYKTNDFALWVNGFEVGTDVIGNSPSGLQEIDFDNGASTADFYGKTKEIAYYDTILTDAELEYLTSYRSLNELVTELNLNTL